VKYVLGGGVRKAGDQVRITVQLADATTGEELWAERYDRRMKDVFALQDEIVRRIVTTLNLQLTLAQQGFLASRTTENIDAYDDVLRGTEYLLTFNKDGNAKARQMFEKAIELDPKYADAYSSLGSNYWFGWALQLSPDPNALDRASQLARQAIALDESLPRAHIVLSYTYLYKRQYDQAATEAERAVALDPNSALGYEALATIVGESGKPGETVDFAEKAIRLDPQGRYRYLGYEGWAYTQMGRYAEAIPIFKLNLARYPNSLFSRTNLILDYTELGREQEAREEAAEVLRISPQFSLEVLYQRAPQKDEAYRKRFFADARKAGLK
jgi:tetratricopeptide (TPR) repeat protein